MAFGRLQRSHPAAPMHEINVTPMVDVMLVLLVIFILTAPLLTSAIRLDLPQTEAAQSGQAPSFVTVVINRQGLIFLNDQSMSLAALTEQLSRIASERPQSELQLRADQTVPYGQVMQVMGVAQKAGLSRIGFVADAQVPAQAQAQGAGAGR